MPARMRRFRACDVRDMKRYLNDPTPDPEASYMPKDMRDDRTCWQRFVMIFRGYKPLPWYWL